MQIALRQRENVAIVEVLPMPMLPVANWGVGLVQSSEFEVAGAELELELDSG